LGITVIPLLIRFGETEYRDGVDLNAEQFYQKLFSSKTLPVTSVPAPLTFAETYDRLAEETDQILAIMLSSKLSGLYNVALQSVGLMRRKCRVEVIDSRWAAIAQGFIVMSAARAAKAGANLDEVLAVAHRNMSRVDFRAVFDTLEYLRRGGRIGRAQAFLGSVLNIKPIISLRGGVVEGVAKVRSRKKAIEYLYQFAMSYSNIEEMAVEDTYAPEADAFIERLGSKFPKERIYRTKMTPAIGTHTGPGLLVVAVMGDR